MYTSDKEDVTTCVKNQQCPRGTALGSSQRDPSLVTGVGADTGGTALDGHSPTWGYEPRGTSACDMSYRHMC